jgi:hypothetical protein
MESEEILADAQTALNQIDPDSPTLALELARVQLLGHVAVCAEVHELRLQMRRFSEGVTG